MRLVWFGTMHNNVFFQIKYNIKNEYKKFSILSLRNNRGILGECWGNDGGMLGKCC